MALSAVWVALSVAWVLIATVFQVGLELVLVVWVVGTLAFLKIAFWCLVFRALARFVRR